MPPWAALPSIKPPCRVLCWMRERISPLIPYWMCRRVLGGCLTDIVRQRDEFCRIDGVDNAQTGLFRIIACQRFGKILQLVFVLQQGFRFGQQYFARPRQYHAFPRAPEQRRADIFFKGFNLGGNGGLGKEKSFGGLGKVALVRDGDK
ncbi:hypothetical protein F9Z36_1846 [Neisseria gonorrhoeae]|nr:hypothetical protein F9Z36_1846 [Neisseria gonorrhoeae]